MAATRKAAARTRVAVLAFPGPKPASLSALLPSGRALAAGFAILALASGSYAGARFTSFFAVREVVVTGAPPALAARVEKSLAATAGRSLLELDLAALEARVVEIPDVASVRWDRAFPNRLVATVEPERPAAVLRRADEAWLLSERGRVLRTLRQGERPLLPRVWVPRSVGAAVGARIGETPVAAALRALRPLPADFPVRVRSVTASESLVFELASGLELRLGAEVDVALKLAVAATILPSLAAPEAGGPRYLDISVPERPVTRLNPQVEGRD